MSFLLFIFKFCRGSNVVEKKQPEGTIKDFAAFDAQQDCNVLREAIKGEAGRDEAKIVEIVAFRSNAQRQVIKDQYAVMFAGADLVEDLKSELGGQFLDVVLALFAHPNVLDSWCLHESMESTCTPAESILIELMFSRRNEEIEGIIDAYETLYDKKLSNVLEKHEESCYFSKLFYTLVYSKNESKAFVSRAEGIEEEAKAKEDAQVLLSEKLWSSPESRFQNILCHKSFEQLEHIFRAYKKVAKKSVEEAIKSEAGGELEKGLLDIVKCVRDTPRYFAERLHECLRGAGTNDKHLIHILVSRSEVDLVQVKECFEMKFGKSLGEFLEDDISKHDKLMESYRNVMLQICRGNAPIPEPEPEIEIEIEIEPSADATSDPVVPEVDQSGNSISIAVSEVDQTASISIAVAEVDQSGISTTTAVVPDVVVGTKQ